MTVEELIEELNALPRTATILVQIRKNVGYENGALDELYEFREEMIETVLYGLGRVVIQLDE